MSAPECSATGKGVPFKAARPKHSLLCIRHGGLLYALAPPGHVLRARAAAHGAWVAVRREPLPGCAPHVEGGGGLGPWCPMPYLIVVDVSIAMMAVAPAYRSARRGLRGHIRARNTVHPPDALTVRLPWCRRRDEMPCLGPSRPLAPSSHPPWLALSAKRWPEANLSQLRAIP